MKVIIVIILILLVITLINIKSETYTDLITRTVMEKFEDVSGVTGRYIRIDKSGGDQLNIAEIKVFDKDLVEIPGGVVTLSSVLPGYPGSNLLDSNLDTFVHTNNDGNKFIVIDLQKSVGIYRIDITNRKDCCQDRMINSVVSIRNESNLEVFKTDLITVSLPKYSFYTMPKDKIKIWLNSLVAKSQTDLDWWNWHVKNIEDSVANSVNRVSYLTSLDPLTETDKKLIQSTETPTETASRLANEEAQRKADADYKAKAAAQKITDDAEKPNARANAIKETALQKGLIEDMKTRKKTRDWLKDRDADIKQSLLNSLV